MSTRRSMGSPRCRSAGRADGAVAAQPASATVPARRARPTANPTFGNLGRDGGDPAIRGRGGLCGRTRGRCGGGPAADRPREPPPYKPEAEAQRQYFLARRGMDDPMARCLLTGVPRIKFRPLPFEIVQLPDRVIMLYEIHHAFRIIPTDGRPHSRGCGAVVSRRLRRALGGRYVRRRRHVVQRQHWLAGVGTVHSESSRDGALHARHRTTRSVTKP